jgi:hypothetical protein
MEILIDGKKHSVVYITYCDNIPDSAITRDEYGFDYWDFFAEQGDKKDIRAYNSGAGHASDIQAPHWVDGFLGRYWICDGYKFKGKPINGKKLKYPKKIQGCGCNSINPFKVAEITNSCEYCERCGHYSTDFCNEHKYYDDEVNVRYKDDDSYE